LDDDELVRESSPNDHVMTIFQVGESSQFSQIIEDSHGTHKNMGLEEDLSSGYDNVWVSSEASGVMHWRVNCPKTRRPISVSGAEKEGW